MKRKKLKTTEEERNLRATLDMWENMEEEQRLMQLKFLLNESFKAGQKQEREDFDFKLKCLITDIERHFDKVVNPKENILRALKELKSKLSEEKQDEY